MSRSGPRRIAYIARWPGGGSVTGLFDLVRTLDPARYEAVVVFYEHNHYVPMFEGIGVRVRVLDARATGIGIAPQPGRAIATSPAAAPTSTLRDRLLAATRDVRRLVRRDIPRARGLLRILRAERVDVVHHNNDVFSNRDAILASAIAGLPQVCHVRWIQKDDGLTAGYLIDGGLTRLVDRFIYMGEAIRRSYGRFRIPTHREHVIDDPFDLAEYGTGADRAAARGSLGVAPDRLMLVNVGRIIPWKGQDVFLRAFARIAHRFPLATAVVVGGADGVPANEAYLAQLRAFAAESGMADRILFTGHRSDAAAIMEAADVVVHSAVVAEPFGRVVVEAMASRRPVIATAAGGPLEIVESGVTGLLVPPGDAEAMGAAMAELLADPARAAAMGGAAREAAERRYSLHVHAERVQAIYDALLPAAR